MMNDPKPSISSHQFQSGWWFCLKIWKSMGRIIPIYDGKIKTFQTTNQQYSFHVFHVPSGQHTVCELGNIAIFYSWVNQLFLWPCSIAIMKLPEGPKRRNVAGSTTGRLLAWISTVKCEFKVEHWNQNPTQNGKLNIWMEKHTLFFMGKSM